MLRTCKPVVVVAGFAILVLLTVRDEEVKERGAASATPHGWPVSLGPGASALEEKTQASSTDSELTLPKWRNGEWSCS